MNIAGVMAALDDWELDHSAKHAYLVLWCRADRHTAAATVPIPRIAADMKVAYATARRALQRLEDSGRVAVDKHPGFSTTWRLVRAPEARGGPPSHARPTPRVDDGGSARQKRGGSARQERGQKESLEKYKEQQAAQHTTQECVAPPVDIAPPRVPPNPSPADSTPAEGEPHRIDFAAIKAQLQAPRSSRAPRRPR
jgi:hypothetical protein